MASAVETALSVLRREALLLLADRGVVVVRYLPFM
jgi:hypothetical protein